MGKRVRRGEYARASRILLDGRHHVEEVAKVLVDAEEFHADTFNYVSNPGIYKFKCVGDVLAGPVKQGTVKPGEETIFLPTHTSSSSQWKRTITSMETRLGKTLDDVRKNGDLWWLRPEQSADTAGGVHVGKEVFDFGAGHRGIMFG